MFEETCGDQKGKATIRSSNATATRRDVLHSIETNDIVLNDTSPGAAINAGDAEIRFVGDGNGKAQKCRQHEQAQPIHGMTK